MSAKVGPAGSIEPTEMAAYGAEETTAQIADGPFSIPEAVRISDLVNNDACENAGNAEFCSKLLGPHRSFSFPETIIADCGAAVPSRKFGTQIVARQRGKHFAGGFPQGCRDAEEVVYEFIDPQNCLVQAALLSLDGKVFMPDRLLQWRRAAGARPRVFDSAGGQPVGLARTTLGRSFAVDLLQTQPNVIIDSSFDCGGIP
jgi:hypothetical protein